MRKPGAAKAAVGPLLVTGGKQVISEGCAGGEGENVNRQTRNFVIPPAYLVGRIVAGADLQQDGLS